MLRDNPFFTKEWRRLRGRRLRGLVQALGWSILSLVLLPLLPVGIQYYDFVRSHGASGIQPPPVGWLLVPHTILCLWAAGKAGSLLFLDEVRQSTWEAVRLLPYPPAQWLRAKGQFPLYLVGIVWSIGFPLYVLAAVVGMGPTRHVLLISLLPLAAALLFLCLSLGGSWGVSVQKQSSAGAPGVASPAPLSGLASLHSALALVPAFVWLLPLVFLGRWAGLRLLHVPVPAGVVLLLVAVPTAWGSWRLGEATLSGSAVAERTAARTLGLCIAFLTLLTLEILPLPLLVNRGIWLIVGIVAAVRVSKAGLAWRQRRAVSQAKRPAAKELSPEAAGAKTAKKRREPRAGLRRRLEARMGRWDNPVFIRDLRLYSRLTIARGCTAGFLYQPFFYLWRWVASTWTRAQAAGSSAETIGILLTLVPPLLEIAGVWALIHLVCGPFEAYSSLVRGSGENGQVDADLLTPMPSEELLRGKALAAATFAWTRDAWMLSLIAAGAVAAVADGRALVLAALLGLLPLLAMAAGAAGYQPPNWKSNTLAGLGDVGPPLGAALLAALELVGCTWLLSLIRFSPAAAWGMALAVAPLNAWFVRWWWTRRVELLDRLRCGELDPAGQSRR